MKKTADRIKNVEVWANNFKWMSIEGGLYFTGYTFFDVYVVIPVFVYELTGNLKLAGLAAAIKLSFYILPQLFMGHYTPLIQNVPRFLGRVGFTLRLCFFAAAFVMLTGFNPYWKVIIVYLALSLGVLADGFTHVAWLDVLGRTMDSSMRARMLGKQQLLGGLGSFGAGLLIKYVLASGLDRDIKYMLVFGMGALTLSVSGYLLYKIKDNQRTFNTKEVHVLKYLKGLHRYVVENKKYISFIITQCLANMGGLAAPFYVLFAKKVYNINDNAVSTLMLLQIAGGLIGGVMWGFLSHKKSNRFTIRTTLSANLILALTALGMSLFKIEQALPLLGLTAFGAGLLLGAWLGYTNYLLEIIKEELRPVYIAITSAITFPLTFTSFVGGVIIDNFGFGAVFAAVAVFMMIALVSSVRLEKV